MIFSGAISCALPCTSTTCPGANGHLAFMLERVISAKHAQSTRKAPASMSRQTGGVEAEPQSSKYQNREAACPLLREGARLRLRQSLAVPALSSKLLVLHLGSMAGVHEDSVVGMKHRLPVSGNFRRMSSICLGKRNSMYLGSLLWVSLFCQTLTNAELDSQRVTTNIPTKILLLMCWMLRRGDCAILSLSIFTFTSWDLRFRRQK